MFKRFLFWFEKFLGDIDRKKRSKNHFSDLFLLRWKVVDAAVHLHLHFNKVREYTSVYGPEADGKNLIEDAVKVFGDLALHMKTVIRYQFELILQLIKFTADQKVTPVYTRETIYAFYHLLYSLLKRGLIDTIPVEVPKIFQRIAKDGKFSLEGESTPFPWNFTEDTQFLLGSIVRAYPNLDIRTHEILFGYESAYMSEPLGSMYHLLKYVNHIDDDLYNNKPLILQNLVKNLTMFTMDVIVKLITFADVLPSFEIQVLAKLNSIKKEQPSEDDLDQVNVNSDGSLNLNAPADGREPLVIPREHFVIADVTGIGKGLIDSFLVDFDVEIIKQNTDDPMRVRYNVLKKEGKDEDYELAKKAYENYLQGETV